MTSPPARVAVLGPGGVGGLLAAALHRAGTDVTVVAREDSVARIARDGIPVRSVVLGDWVARPRAVARLADAVDVLLVTVKAPALEDALARVEAEAGLVVPLLNGFEHVPRLRERFAERAVAGTIRVESTASEDGVVHQTSRFLRVEVASDAGAPLDGAAELLANAGVPTAIGESEAQVLWSKLCRLNALACTTAASGLPLGAIREDAGWRAALEGCVEETTAVARAQGARMEAAPVLAELDEAHPTLVSSLARDVAAGRETELDPIAGAVLRAGARHGLACPTVEAMVARIRERMAESGAR